MHSKPNFRPGSILSTSHFPFSLGNLWGLQAVRQAQGRASTLTLTSKAHLVTRQLKSRYRQSYPRPVGTKQHQTGEGASRSTADPRALPPTRLLTWSVTHHPPPGPKVLYTPRGKHPSQRQKMQINAKKMQMGTKKWPQKIMQKMQINAKMQNYANP